MLWKFLYHLHVYFFPFNVFRYITFRTIYATITALLISLLLGPWVIRKLREYRVGQVIREDGPAQHFKKRGTPTMGGVLIILSVVFSTLLWANLGSRLVWISMLSLVGYGAIGFWDDYLKVRLKNPRGIGAKRKFALQMALALVLAFLLYENLGVHSTDLLIPFFKKVSPHLGAFYIPFALLVIVGASNAVNLTDGMDGLAIVPATMCFATYSVIAYLVGHYKFAQYLKIFYVPGAGEVAVFCGALVGASLGFLWFNSYPAQMFMGDTGSLSLGGTLGTVALITKHELLLVIVGGIFVIETLSVILQVGYFKMTGGKRIFRMAPIHHHFEQKGLPEPKIIVRFWIISLIFALVALSTLKLR